MTPHQRRVLSIRLSALPQFVLAALFLLAFVLAWTSGENEDPGPFLGTYLLACAKSAGFEFFFVAFGGFFGYYLFHPWIRAVAIALLISASWGIGALYGLKGLLAVSPLLATSVRGMLVMSEARGYKTVEEFYGEFFPPRFLLLSALTLVVTFSAFVIDSMGIDVLERPMRVESKSRKGDLSSHAGLFESNPHIPLISCSIYFVVFGLADFRRRPPPRPPRSLLDPPA